MTAPDSVTTDIARQVSRHGVYGFNGDEVACRCDHVWRNGWEYEKHVAAAIAARLAEREAALLCSQCGEQLACMVKVGTADGWCATCLDEASERGGEVGALAEVEHLRPYAPGTPLIVVSKVHWEDADAALSEVPDLQDALANAEAYAEGMPDRIADFLLSYSADGDSKQLWQDGHNYAMREAARMVRERWFNLGPVAGTPHFKPDGPNGETTTCDCPKGVDHD